MDRWVFGARLIDDDIGVDRARQRFTLVYRFTDAFQAGVEWNPLADDVGLLANWRVFEETAKRPALIVGTSSDRIGTTDGRSIYATLSKSLQRELGLPLAPYAGVVFGGQDDAFDAIGGLHVSYGKGFESLHFYDGHNLHHVVTKSFGRHAAGLLLAEQDDEHFLGVSYTVSFSPERLFASRSSEEP